MTKVLDIAKGEFLVFLTSIEYDRKIWGEEKADSLSLEEQKTFIWENAYERNGGRVLLEHFLKGFFDHPNEYEIIND